MTHGRSVTSSTTPYSVTVRGRGASNVGSSPIVIVHFFIYLFYMEDIHGVSFVSSPTVHLTDHPLRKVYSTSPSRRDFSTVDSTRTYRSISEHY